MTSDRPNPADVFSRPEVVLLFVVLAVVVTVAVTLTVIWPWKLLVIVVGTPAATILCSLFSPQLGRLARFLVLIPRPGPPLSTNVTFLVSAKATVIRKGADANDPNASRVVTEYLDGDLQPRAAATCAPVGRHASGEGMLTGRRSRKFAEEWTYRFLAAALADATGAGVE